jgi:hypothetical protein
MSIANQPKNAKYIGYECIVCGKKIEEDERQKIIALGCVQTWCMLCIAKRYPSDKHLLEYVRSNGNNDVIIDRNNLLNNQ